MQHANEDVEKMILGNKCDMADKRQVPRQKGEEVIPCIVFIHLAYRYYDWCHKASVVLIICVGPFSKILVRTLVRSLNCFLK